MKNYILTSFFLKSYFKDLRTVVGLILAIIIPLFSINIIISFPDTSSVNQMDIDWYFFWNSFLVYSILFYRFMTVIISSDIISGDFSNKSVMILYSSPLSRSRIIILKIISMVLYLLFFEIISYLLFEIILYIFVDSAISLNFLIIGFSFNFLNILFGLSFSLFLSATTRNTIISALIPFIYLYVGPYLFGMINLDYLSYTYLSAKVANVISNFIKTGIFFFEFEDVLNLILLISIPFIIILITLIIFRKVDIRT
jgi:ABC-type transport system involved in multi-copper enzyme maturation permease subunit